MQIGMTPSNNLVLFASGGGSNAIKIIEYFQDHPSVSIACIVCNNENAGIVSKAESMGIQVEIITKKELNDTDFMLSLLQKYEVSLLVLAGFLLLIPKYLVEKYNNRIINIHPSLLPKFGGKGMHGIHIHKAVIAAEEQKSGITIHLVNEEYDKGEILFQKEIDVTTDNPEELAKDILKLEHQYFSEVIARHLGAL
jgi:phosphoribosylglycinamide formyltransferase 1